MFRFNSKFLLLGIFLFAHLFVGLAQEKNSSIISAFQKGSSKALSSFLGKMVEIRFDNSKKDFSKSQAEIVLANFFKSNPVKSFKLQKENKIDAKNSFLIGTYTSINNQFSVLIKGKELDDGRWLVNSLDFVKK
ncbi:DUF4783 domain-containing protein [Cyclobacterium marinum]|uniref:DUF4783 domain-containing protein n=1 Tax=Cyclobacterium marinum (strain ATCC 25205 / DSM 745 / LMG 13164 / NCIMB 1802) TaxID=880070 RepID=G0IWX7_CYCMS|nr:DUF4783 domain-containing protein [Cyclobacterium marinum]AEL24895.1 hypothetical protein Cycma_1123 [Cyclobacterium marinum DSM 745]MBI0401629.1 DUF4783 domain-containing protein [Cyclobacterium marinum]MBR9776395.1 DUF4783 domain-containing protein [Cytophagales bacterium]|tara:strand:- start:81805 stop:82206 length:402 start_codon:yes stop_codon:yes gene_type:complete